MDDKNLFLGIDHFGINCTENMDAIKNAALFNELFNLEITDGQYSIYAGSTIELMKKGNGRGKCGHIAVATRDIEKAEKFLESKGFEFEPGSAKYDSTGRLIVLYLKSEIAGFAIHLLQK